MKTKTLKSLVLLVCLFLTSFHLFAKGSGDDRGDYAYYIMSPKAWHHNSNNGGDNDDKWLRIFSRAGEVKSVSFKGTIQIPETLRANTGLLREGRSQAVLILDGRIQCTYEASLSKRFFNAIYGFISCTDRSRPKDEVRVDSTVGLYLKDVKGTPATIYASIKVSERFSQGGFKLPQLEATKGQILRFDGDVWVAADYIPDGQSSGDVLLWDGTAWMASKLSAGSQGPVGPQGPQGVQGIEGAQGPQGLTGLTGATGAQGSQGLTGLTGATGAQGPQGLTGLTGAVGPQGLQGLTGAKGDKGDTGAIGPQGLQGIQGNPGLVSLTAGTGILGGTILGNGGTIAVNTGTSAGQIPVIDATGKLPSSIMPDAPQKIAFIKDLKPSGTNGGTCDPTKAWEQIRDLNNLSGDTSFVTLSANQFTLSAGTYVIEANAIAYLDGLHRAVLVNAQTSEFLILGSNARSHATAGGMEPSMIMGQVVIATPTTFVVKHRCQTLMNNVGFGMASSFGVDEIYTQVKIIKIK
jgi:hypothetical protein